MPVLVDTNVLLRRTQPNHEHHAVAMESVARLLAANETVCFTPQNISEFWNVVTRPVAHNGLGFSVSLVTGEVEKIERMLTLIRTLKESGLAVILISHRLQDIMTVCDRVVVMKSGALVRDLNVRTTDIDEIVKLMVSGGEMGAMPKASATAWSDHPTAQPPA